MPYPQRGIFMMSERIGTQNGMDMDTWINFSRGLSLTSLFRAYPQLEDFKDLVISKIRIAGPPFQITDLEKGDRPRTGFYLYDEFCQMGVPGKVLDSYYYQTRAASLFYPDYPNNQIWLSEHFSAGFNSPKWLDRIVSLGDILIEQALRTIALRLCPYSFGEAEELFLRPMMEKTLKPTLKEGFASELKGKDQRRTYRTNIEEWMSDLFTASGFSKRRARFESVGAEIFCLFPDQPVLRADISMGRDFDKGTVEHVAQRPKELFRKYLEEVLGGLSLTPLIPSQEQQAAERIFAIWDLDQDDVLRKYTHSWLADSYLHSTNPGLHPLNYPQLVA